jgi:putative transcriptional regulator
MNIGLGIILISTPSINDVNFDDVLIFITEHNLNGAMGFVINKKSDRVINELAEFRNCIAFPLYNGGPVDKEHLFFIHRKPNLIDGGTAIANDIYLGGDFKKAIALINSNTISEKDIKIFIGYCGWDFNELEEEMKEGGWMISSNTSQAVF